jgi:uncharacterized protein YxjI
MSRTLTFARKLMSLKDRVTVADASGAQLYEASWSFGFPTRTWEISNGSGVIASFRRRLFALTPRWDVDAPAGAYVLRKPWFSFLRHMRVVGGPFDGVEMTGGLFQMNYKIEQGSRLLARADTKILTFRDQHDCVIMEDTPGIEELCVVLVLNLMVEEFARKAKSAQEV